MPEHWIQEAIKHRGALHRQLGVPIGKKIPAGKLHAVAQQGGKLGKRARLAETLKGLSHKHHDYSSEMCERVTKMAPMRKPYGAR